MELLNNLITEINNKKCYDKDCIDDLCYVELVKPIAIRIINSKIEELNQIEKLIKIDIDNSVNKIIVDDNSGKIYINNNVKKFNKKNHMLYYIIAAITTIIGIVLKILN